jgi:RNA polymerase sigma factor (sigma-70 family)
VLPPVWGVARLTHFSPSGDLEVVRRDYAGASDAELLEAQDADAFAVVYDRHADALLAWSRRRVGDHGADLTAEVFARAWLSRHSFRDQADGSAFPWLYGIAQNVLRDSLRRRRVETGARRRLGLPTEVAPDPAYEAVEQRLSLPEATLQAIAELSADEREVLRLRIVEERPYREIAARLGCTTTAARLRVSRTLRRLNLALGGQRK